MSTAKPTLSERLAAVSAGVQRLGYDGQMGGREAYKYASVNAIADLARPLLAEHGVAIVPGAVEVLRHDEVTSKNGARGYHVVILRAWTVMAGDERIEAESIGGSLDYSDKAYNKAHTYARKNLLVDLLNLSTGDDPDAERPDAGHREEPRQQAAPPARSVRRATTNWDQLVAFAESQKMSFGTLEATMTALFGADSGPAVLDDPANYAKAMDAVRGVVGGEKDDLNHGADPVITDKQAKRYHAIRNKAGVSEERGKEIILDLTGQDSSAAIPKRLYESVIATIEAEGEKVGAAA